MSWLSLDGEPWAPLVPGAQELAGFRFEHLGPSGDPPIVTAGDLPVIHYPWARRTPSRLRDLQLFRSWAEQRRVGPQPGVELALGLFNHHPTDPTTFGNYARTVWRDAVGGERGMDHGLVVLMIMAGDANIAGRLSVPQTEDLVWFLARSAFILLWMDADRIDREDMAIALPVTSLCVEVVEMATRGIALGKGLPTKVARIFTQVLYWAVLETRFDDPSRPRLFCDYGVDASDPDVESDEEEVPHPATLL
jgi:hypothetical protein